MTDSAVPGELTELLAAWRVGERGAFDRLIPLVYSELRRMAKGYLHHERAGHTLQPTALVHELFSRLVHQKRADLRDRRHFFAIAATTMRRILVDHARIQNAQKRGRDVVTVSLDNLDEIADPHRSGELLLLNDLLEQARCDGFRSRAPSSTCATLPACLSRRPQRHWRPRRPRSIATGAWPRPGCCANSKPSAELASLRPRAHTHAHAYRPATTLRPAYLDGAAVGDSDVGAASAARELVRACSAWTSASARALSRRCGWSGASRARRVARDSSSAISAACSRPVARYSRPMWYWVRAYHG